MKKAMIDAGYSESYADRNSRYLMGIIGDEIRTQQEEICNEKIKDIKAIQEWWSSVMDNEEEHIQNRIKCSELLAKAQGAFVTKIEADVKSDVVVNVELVDE